MRYFYVEPEVAGGFGENAVLLDPRARPPLVSHFHYEFYGWLGDVLLETVVTYIVTEEAKEKLLDIGATGIRFADVEVSLSGFFEDRYPGRRLPKFVWLQVFGEPGKDDFGIRANINLVVSERALDVLKRLQLIHASITPYEGTAPPHQVRSSP